MSDQHEGTDATLPRVGVRAPLWLTALTVVALAAVVLHLGATYLWVRPSTPASSAVNAPLRSYMLPLFQQNWSLFAPNPVADQFLLEVRGVSEDLKATTPWLTPSADELGELKHSVLPNRTVRLTAELSRSAARSIEGLPDEAEKYIGWNYHYDAWNRLRADMAATSHGSVSTSMNTALGYDEVLTLYASQFLAAAPHDRFEVTYVQYRIVRDQTEGYYSAARGTTNRTTVVTSGRRPLETRPGQDTDGFRAFVDSQGWQ